MSDEEFADSVKSLKQIVFRGLRSFVVLGTGLAGLGYTIKRKRQKEEEAKAKAEKAPSDDPTERYLREMENIGWDVQGHEEEVRKAKAKGPPK